MKIAYNVLIIMLLPVLVFANTVKEQTVKERTISKTFVVNTNSTAQINNRYGSIKVVLTNEDKISIDVHIQVSGNNEKSVIRKFNSIDVAFSNSVSLVKAATIFNNESNSSWRESLNLEINYLVKIPKNGHIDLTNKYGNIYVEELNGTSKIELNYGSLTLGQFKNNSNNIELQYVTNSTIDFIDNLKIKCNYSKLSIEKNYGILIDGNYNDFNFQNVGIVKFDGNYTKLKSRTMVKFNCDGNYLTLKLGEVVEAAIESNYSTIEITAISKTKNITVEANYSQTEINCTENFDFDFDLSTTYGGFKTNLDLNYSEKSEIRNAKNYKGFHISKGKSKIKVASNYGGISIIKN
jgi:hypothetical protein